MKIKALRDITHGGVYHVAGNEFEVSETDGAYYIARRRKIMAVTAPDESVKEEPMQADFPMTILAERRVKWTVEVSEAEEPMKAAAMSQSQPVAEEPTKPEEEAPAEQGDKSDTPAERVKRKYVRRDQTLDGEPRQYQRRDMTAEE